MEHRMMDASWRPEFLFGEMVAKIIYAAAELRLADLLGEGPRTCAELAERTSTRQESLRRLLRALAGLRIVTQTDADRFELGELGGPLRADAPDSQRSLVTMRCGPEVWRSWDQLLPCLQSGTPGWELAHGMSWVDFYARNPERSANFNRAMAEHTRDAAPGIVSAAELGRFHTVVDLGGGDGTLMAEALSAHPHLQGVVFDLPSGLDSAIVTERCRVVAGNFFDSVPEGADAYLLKQVLHDWGDEACIDILRTVRAAASPKARVLIVDRLLPELVSAADTQTLLVDVLMMLVTGGRERTQAEFRALLDTAGFELTRVSEAIPPFDYRVIEGVPVARLDAPTSWT
jgi:O-methyltransferase domain/Dimerisation domain